MSKPKPHFTPAKRAGDFIFVSGQMPFDEDMNIVGNNIEEQTHVCIDHISRALEAVGSSLDRVVKNMAWLIDPEDFAAFNSTYAQYFPENPPARATVGTVLMVPGARIEIEAVAYHPL